MRNKRFLSYMYFIAGTALALGLGMANSAKGETVMKQAAEIDNGADTESICGFYQDRIADLEQMESGYCLSGRTLKALSEDSAKTLHAYMRAKEEKMAEKCGVSVEKIRKDGVWLEYADSESPFYQEEGIQTDNSSYYLIYDEALSGDPEKDFMGRVADLEIILADEDGDYYFRVDDSCFVLSVDGEILDWSS